MTERTRSERILCVDDEPNVLEGLQRILFESFDVSTAPGGVEGLDVIEREGPFAVVVSDMRMPGMNGAEFLGRVREANPDTVRILLTGHADFESTVSAVNEGNIFRFLHKPCPPEVLHKALEDALEQHRLVRAERDLVEKTLQGAVGVLVDVLALASPAAFQRAGHLKSYVAHMARQIGVSDVWEFEVAALLSQIGSISLPVDALEKIYAGQRVSEEELRMYERHPEVGGGLMARIPRLERVSEMIRCQREESRAGDPRTRLGAAMIHLARDLDRIVAGGVPVEEALEKVRRTGAFTSDVLDAMTVFMEEERQEFVKAVPLKELRSGMVLDEEVRSTAGSVIVGKGWRVTAALIERLKNFNRSVGVVQPIRVRIPVNEAGTELDDRAA